MKLRAITACLAAILACGNAAYAADDEPTQDAAVKAKAVDPKKVKSSEAKTMKTQCYTNETNCSGRTLFQNEDASREMACSIYFNNGASGQTNFVLPAKQANMIHVRTGDTYACAWGKNVPASNAPRYYVWVR